MLEAGVCEELLEGYRAYLRRVAEEKLNPRLAPKLDPSDIVQNTLLLAFRSLEQFRGDTEAEFRSWLRRILERNIQNVVRFLTCEKRDFRREVSLENALGRSSVKLLDFCVKIDPSPSTRLAKDETCLQLMDAIFSLPPDQMRAVLLRHWSGYSLLEISRRMERSCQSVAGLLRRGLKTIRDKMRNAG